MYATIAGVAAVFLIGPGLVPNGKHRELHWTWWEHLGGDVYILVAAALIVAGVWQLVRLRTRRTPASASAT